METLKILLTGLIFALMSWVNPSENSSDTETVTGISFHQGTWDEALQMASEEGKPIFLDISASWCGPCKRLKANTFTDPEVGKLFNAGFINVVVDGEKGEGIHLAKKFNIRGYPSLIFIDSDEQLIAQATGYRTPEQLIGMGRQVLERYEFTAVNLLIATYEK